MRSKFCFGFLGLAVAYLVAATAIDVRSLVAEEIQVPAFTAYILPDPHAVRVSESHGVSRWNDAKQSVNWYGLFQKTGELTAKVDLVLAKNSNAKLQLTIDGVSHQADVSSSDNSNVVADFGTFDIGAAGFQRIALEFLGDKPSVITEIQSLRLDGPAVEAVHFNLKERRNAASVHLMYSLPTKDDVEAFYCEVTGVEEPTSTFYMACGWHRGYFGMQVNSPTERRIIFSVWDSGNEAIDRKNVQDENRVKLMGKGEGVYTGDFGNEGTGGHSHLKYLWKTGEVQRFVVFAKPVDKTFTIYSGYWWHPEKDDWMLISSWKAPKEGGYLKGLHSFSENFDGSNGHLPRKALYNNPWVRTKDGEWFEVTNSRFSHDPTGKSDRMDRFMGVEGNAFFLSHGGFIPGSTKYGEGFDRKASGKKPDLKNLAP